MRKKSKNSLVWMFVGIILALGVIYYIYSGTKPGTYDAFAECLGESGTTFYGAFWCPHCQSQKSKFGRSEKKLPYVECSQPNGQGQTKVCIDAGIESYPTWEFPDGTRETGDLSLPYLAEKTGCELPN